MKKWYILNTRPKKESQVERLFEEGGFEVYNPKYKSDNRIHPFFPGYQFILFDYPTQYKMVKYTRGVKRIVGNDEGPIPIGPEIIEAVRSREINGFVELEKYGTAPKIGDEIEVAEGALKGLRGIFKKEVGGSDRVLILLNYVSYQAKMIVDKKKVKKVIS